MSPTAARRGDPGLLQHAGGHTRGRHTPLEPPCSGPFFPHRGPRSERVQGASTPTWFSGRSAAGLLCAGSAEPPSAPDLLAATEGTQGGGGRGLSSCSPPAPSGEGAWSRASSAGSGQSFGSALVSVSDAGARRGRAWASREGRVGGASRCSYPVDSASWPAPDGPLRVGADVGSGRRGRGLRPRGAAVLRGMWVPHAEGAGEPASAAPAAPPRQEVTAAT